MRSDLIPKRGCALHRVVVADVLLAERLHVVHVEAEHVAEAALEEHRVRAGRDRLVHVALHQPEVLEVAREAAAREQVDLLERRARAGPPRSPVFCAFSTLRYMSRCDAHEAPADWNRARDVAGIAER